MSEGERFVFSGIILLALLEGIVFGYGWGKHAADRWWQADEAKKVQAQRDKIQDWINSANSLDSGENLWQDGQETPALSGGKYSRLPYPVCMEDTGIGYGLVPIPCPKEKPKQ